MNRPIDRIAERYAEFVKAPLDERQYTAYASHGNMIADLKWFLDVCGLIDGALVDRLDRFIEGQPRQRRLTSEQVNDIATLLAYVRRMRASSE